ncbi:Uncharacterized protein YktB, UPF0637 family [Seinonella peptonophila]|uniref:UPF0637 protein SAMN05444392_102122 n=1 Tax=Seinonella peptonophila TaxID=112248 RepID=A0A1M4V1K7_9BACL|nr:DUF1054 domain-containing protein [Seinonella peptonophila]SHE62753.1 Uncharacterized protein YktB, UPF0637 family [Seinonella peptonophila]
MSKVVGFQDQDFALFTIADLDQRMAAIRTLIQPKFTEISEQVETFLTSKLERPFYTHIARHARRTKNPPNETWVSWSASKRGYKSHPHFQFGICESHLFIWFALIYEYPDKQAFAQKLLNQTQFIEKLPNHYYLSGDHTQSKIEQLTTINQDTIHSILKRLETIKKAEFLCGTIIPRKTAAKLGLTDLLTHIIDTYDHLEPLYLLTVQS